MKEAASFYLLSLKSVAMFLRNVCCLTGQQDVISRKTELLIVAVVGASNPTSSPPDHKEFCKNNALLKRVCKYPTTFTTRPYTASQL
jgi:hypothetical protein